MTYPKIKTVYYIPLIAIGCYILSVCNSHKSEVQKTVEEMQSSAIIIPYDQMAYWASAFVIKNMPWNKAN